MIRKGFHRYFYQNFTSQTSIFNYLLSSFSTAYLIHINLDGKQVNKIELNRCSLYYSIINL